MKKRLRVIEALLRALCDEKGIDVQSVLKTVNPSPKPPPPPPDEDGD